jgi:hypothetical protein
LRGETLESVASTIGARKSTLSTIERFPQRASKRLQSKLSSHFNATWQVLTHDLNGGKLAGSILFLIDKQNEAKGIKRARKSK